MTREIYALVSGPFAGASTSTSSKASASASLWIKKKTKKTCKHWKFQTFKSNKYVGQTFTVI